MHFDFPFYSVFFFAGALFTGLIAMIVWYRRPAPGALPFALFTAAMAFWSLMWTFELGSTEIANKIVWAKLEYVGIASIGVLWLGFALEYSGYTWWRKPRNLLLLSIIPLSTLMAVWTNEWHGWFWSDVHFVTNALGQVAVWEHGFWFPVFAAYQYAAVFTGIIILWRFGLRRSQIYRKQVIALSIATMFPIFSNVVYLLVRNWTEGLDLTPLSFTVAGAVYMLTIFRYHFLDVVPVARNVLFARMPDGILVLNNHGFVVDINPAGERLIKSAKAAVVGKQLPTSWRKLEVYSDASGPEEHMEVVSEEQGSATYYEVSSTPLYDKRQSVEGSLIVMRDITARKKAEGELQQNVDTVADLYRKEKAHREELEAEAKARGMFIDVLGHELRTPLTPILASAGLLHEILSSRNETTSKLAGNIYRSSQVLAQRLEELLELARYSRGTFQLRLQPVNLNSYLEDVSSRLRPLVTKPGQSLIIEIPDKLREAVIDASRIEQVIINLISNASKYSPGASSIRFTVKPEGTDLLVEVTDEGIGISPEEQGRLFEPYHRVEQDRQKYPGIGLGLAVCRQIVEAHQGKIWITSEPGKGSTFSFSIPVKVKTAVGLTAVT